MLSSRAQLIAEMKRQGVWRPGRVWKDADGQTRVNPTDPRRIKRELADEKGEYQVYAIEPVGSQPLVPMGLRRGQARGSQDFGLQLPTVGKLNFIPLADLMACWQFPAQLAAADVRPHSVT